VALLACAIACGQSDFVRAADSTDNEQLEQFLARLGLVDLRIQLLERSLQTSSTPEAKLAMARRLADLYAERLMAHAEDMAAYNDTLQRIEKLIQAVPEANTAPLQVMLLQADYNRAESLLTAWMNDPQAESSRAEAQQILDRISPSLLQFDTELNKQAEALLARMDETPEGDAFTALELEAKRVQGIASRAAYFAAWANYYRGLLTRAAPGADPYLQARTIFRRIFGNDAALPPDTDPEGLGLESIWRARAMIGLGLSEAACGDPAACEVCFQLIEKGSVPPEIKDQAPYWYLRSLLNAGQYSAAESYARSQVERMQPPASQGQVSFCAALVREGFTTAAPPDPARQALGPLGFSGLARLDQLAAITTLIDKYSIPAAQRTGLVLQWAAGQDQFAAAEKSKAAADYQTAADTLRTALKSPEVNTLLGPASRCRYTLAWCLYRLDQFEAASREFTTALTGLSAARDALAVESAWMAFVSARRGADAEPRLLPQATEAANRIRQVFPDHPYAKRAQYELTRLTSRSDPESLAKELANVAANDENYSQARYDLCILRHRLWSEQRTDPQLSVARFADLQDAVQTFLRTPQAAADVSQAVKCCLLLADAALHLLEPNLEAARQILDNAAPRVTKLAISDPLTIEYHYRRLELASAQGDADARRQEAQWLTDHAADSPYELAGLLTIANALDREATAASGDSGLQERAYAAYQRVVALLEKSGSLAESKNLQVACSRLAHFASQLGHHAEAADQLEKLLQISPQDRRLLRRAGLAQSQAGQHAKALAHWRTLLLGLPKGSNDWLEAKYYQLLALSKTDPAQARKVMDQFQLLYPELGGTTWRDKFTELSRSWK
jgi:hypothetical protein